MLASKMKLLAAAAAIGCSACAPAGAPGGRPNVVVIFTDDQGYADVGYHGVRGDVKTPHIDALAAAGVRFTAGYVSAPQCSPSRAGLMTGRYQQRFGLNVNGDGALPWSETTLAERFLEAGYVTGMSGKWHLQGAVASNGERPGGLAADGAGGEEIGSPRIAAENPGHVGHHGFAEYLMGTAGHYVATHAADGRALPETGARHRDARFRIAVQSEWAVSFIERQASSGRPFFLYLSFFAPHVPLEAPEDLLGRFPGEMPEPRRLALAMLAAVDDGVGLVVEALRRHHLASRTLIFFLSDNGATLSFHRPDLQSRGPQWNGSLNEPWVGEKGMLSEGGIRVPFAAAWQGVIPPGQTYERPVISLDVAATAIAAAGLAGSAELDGVDLLPYLTGRAAGDPHPALFWRFRNQAAIRAGDWKLLTVGDGRRYLFDLSRPQPERHNLIGEEPERALELYDRLAAWTSELRPPGLSAPANAREERQYDFYLDRKEPDPQLQDSPRPAAVIEHGAQPKVD